MFLLKKALDEKGCPIRDECPTTYAGCIETAEQIGNRIYDEAESRRIETAKRICVIGDGAPWIWNIAGIQFYGATQIIDIYHAREHYWKVTKIMFLRDKSKLKIWINERRKELDRGDVEQVIFAIKSLSAQTKQDKEDIDGEIGYFDKNKERMRYKAFRSQGLFIGYGSLNSGAARL